MSDVAWGFATVLILFPSFLLAYGMVRRQPTTATREPQVVVEQADGALLDVTLHADCIEVLKKAAMLRSMPPDSRAQARFILEQSGYSFEAGKCGGGRCRPARIVKRT